VAEPLEPLRDLARGIYPPFLADRGSLEALSARLVGRCFQSRPEDTGGFRHPQDAEAAIYSVPGALQNAAKPSGVQGLFPGLLRGRSRDAFFVQDQADFAAIL
jgi:hypothetical protein